MSNSILARLLILVAMLPLLFVSVQVTADTFSVTAKDCTTSPGGYQWAIEQANNTPGRDTISIDVPLLYVDGCFHPERALLPIAFTESVDILGNGNTVTGVLTWVSAAGNVNPANSCPPPDAIWINPGGALFDVGIPGTDASGIELTITNVKMERLSTVGIVRKNAKLTIEDSQLTNIRSLHDGCTDSLIQALEGADLTLNNTSITLSGIPADIAPDVDFPLITSLISGTDGDLVMENVTIEASLGTNAASVHWHGGLVKIVSSSFFESHGFWLSDSTIDFVNSVFQNYDFSATFSDNIILNNGSVFRSEASTFYWATKL